MTENQTPGGQQPPGNQPGQQPFGQQQPDGQQPTGPAGQPNGPQAGGQHPAGPPQGEQQPGGQQPQQGSIRYQDPDSTTPREPSLAEQRARRQAYQQEQERAAAAEQERVVAERKAGTKRKALIGSGVTVGLVGLVASWYLVAKPEEVTAVCTDEKGTVQADDNRCDEQYVLNHGGHYGAGGLLILPMSMGGGSYRYNYGGTGAPGSQVSGGTFTKPSGNSNVSTKSGKSVQRGGFGISGKAGTGKGGGS